MKCFRFDLLRDAAVKNFSNSSNFRRTGVDLIKSLQACNYKLVIVRLFKYWWSQVLSSSIHSLLIGVLNLTTLVTTSDLKKDLYSQACKLFIGSGLGALLGTFGLRERNQLE